MVPRLLQVEPDLDRRHIVSPAFAEVVNIPEVFVGSFTVRPELLFQEKSIVPIPEGGPLNCRYCIRLADDGVDVPLNKK